jgi:hypothetical protein
VAPANRPPIGIQHNCGYAARQRQQAYALFDPVKICPTAWIGYEPPNIALLLASTARPTPIFSAIPSVH